MKVTRPSELTGSRQAVPLNQPSCVQTLSWCSVIHTKSVQLLETNTVTMKLLNAQDVSNGCCSLGTAVFKIKKGEETKTTALTPLALQRFLSHMNSLLQTLGWWHPVQRSTRIQGHRFPLHKPRRWVTAPQSLHAPTLLWVKWISQSQWCSLRRRANIRVNYTCL